MSIDRAIASRKFELLRVMDPMGQTGIVIEFLPLPRQGLEGPVRILLQDSLADELIRSLSRMLSEHGPASSAPETKQ